jgi:dihydropteroate synthase
MPRPLIVGILNCTPDSFSDGGAYPDLAAQIARGEAMIAEGADWLDIGGESTRPGAREVSTEEEIARIVPVIAALRDHCPLSVDTRHPAVARAALRAGARILNDISGLIDPEMSTISADFEQTIVMHMRGVPATMQAFCDYPDLTGEVLATLLDRATRANSPQVWIDPGIGFAKTREQNLQLLASLPTFVASGLPVLLGTSRKSFIGQTLGRPQPADRLAGSLATVAAGFYAGVAAFRVHDVAPTRDVLTMLQAIACAHPPPPPGQTPAPERIRGP